MSEEMNKNGMLKKCSTLTGKFEVRTGRPDVSRYENVVYIPVDHYGDAYDPFPLWGLYSQDGIIIP